MKFTDECIPPAATDLSDHLSSAQLTQLKRQVALKEIKPPTWRDPSLGALIQRGQEHEATYVEYLSDQGLTVINLQGQNAEATLAAIEKGMDTIVQAKLKKAPSMGYAVILLERV